MNPNLISRWNTIVTHSWGNQVLATEEGLTLRMREGLGNREAMLDICRNLHQRESEFVSF